MNGFRCMEAHTGASEYLMIQEVCIFTAFLPNLPPQPTGRQVPGIKTSLNFYITPCIQNNSAAKSPKS